MVIALRLKNFFSLREYASLDFNADINQRNNKDHLQENLIDFNGEKFINVIGIFGSNAAGKSNIIRALDFCRNLILYSHLNNVGTKFEFTPFKFGDSKISEFYMDFITEGIEYEYGFTIEDQKIIKEELYYYPKKRKAKIFVREGENYSYGKGIIARPGDVEANTGSQTLFLSRASSMNRPIAQQIYRFFLQEIIVGVGEMKISTISINEFDEYKDLILTALNVGDSDIVDIRLGTDAEGKNVLYTYHKEDPSIEFNFDTEESDGTKRLFFILFRLLKSAFSGATIFLDEFDLKLHLRLAEFIIDFVRATHKAQLVFTSHNAALMSPDNLRPEQIVLVNKEADGNSDFFAVSDFKGMSSGIDIQKAYLQGRFDAVPYVGSPYNIVEKFIENSNGKKV